MRWYWTYMRNIIEHRLLYNAEFLLTILDILESFLAKYHLRHILFRGQMQWQYFYTNIFKYLFVSKFHICTNQPLREIFQLYCMALYCIRARVELFSSQISIAMTLGINSWYSETFTVAKEQTKLSRLDNTSPICYIRCTYFPFMSLCSTLLVHPFESPFTSLHQSWNCTESN